jgi:hypothetical protein
MADASFPPEFTGRIASQPGDPTIPFLSFHRVLAVTRRRIWFLLTFTALPQEHDFFSFFTTLSRKETKLSSPITERTR